MRRQFKRILFPLTDPGCCIKYKITFNYIKLYKKYEELFKTKYDLLKRFKYSINLLENFILSH